MSRHDATPEQILAFFVVKILCHGAQVIVMVWATWSGGFPGFIAGAGLCVLLQFGLMRPP